MHLLIKLEDVMAFIVNCVLINNKISTAIKLGTFVVNELCHVYVTHYVIQVFTAECYLLIQLKTLIYRLMLLWMCYLFNLKN
jgi:hypothetical protein